MVPPWSGNLCLEEFFHLGPVSIDDAVVDGVADATCVRNEMMAEYSFLHGADSSQCFPRAQVQDIGFELHTNAAKSFKGVAK